MLEHGAGRYATAVRSAEHEDVKGALSMGELMAQMNRRAWIGVAVALIVVVGGIVTVTMLAHAGGRATTTPVTTAKNCGAVRNQLALSTDPAEAAKAEQCFADAFKTCAPATLIFTTSGVDAGATHSLSITRQGSKCVVSDSVQSDVNTTQRTISVTCTGAAQQSDGMHLTGCGDFGDFVVAARGQQQ